MTRQQKRLLPKAKLIKFWWVNRWPYDYRSRSPFFLRWRSANAWGFMFGRLGVSVRAPWLARAARQLHPEIFCSGETGPLGSENAR